MSELPPLRRNYRFQVLWIGGAVSQLGSSLTWLAFPLLILAVTGSPALAGIAGACRLAASIAVSLPAGVWVDRLDRRRILIVSEATRCLTLATLVLAILADHVGLWHIVAVAVANGVADACFNPAHATAIRAVVPAAQLPAAFAQEEARSHAASLAGPPLGGLLFALGRVFPFLVDAITYVISMICIVIAKVPRHPVTVAEPKRSTMRTDIAEAAGWLWRQHGMRAALALSLAANLGANTVLIPVIVLVGERGGDSTTTGLVLAGMGAGGLLGATVSARIGKLLPPGKLILAVVGIFAVAISATALPLGAYWPVVPLVLATVAVPAINVALRVLVATLVPDQMMGRLVSLLTMASMGIAPLGPLLGGLLSQYVGGAGAVVAIGAFMLASCMLAAFSRALRDLAGPSADQPQTGASVTASSTGPNER